MGLSSLVVLLYFRFVRGSDHGLWRRVGLVLLDDEKILKGKAKNGFGGGKIKSACSVDDPARYK
jgi:hypothetical protein